MKQTWTKAEREARRRRSVGLLNRGRGIREVGRLVGACPAAVVKWRDAYRRFGEDGLKAKPGPGSKPRLKAAQRRLLAKMLLRGARWYGFGTDLWTLERVAQVIQSQFRVRYHPGHVWKILRAMQWSCQKPERRARERDEQAIEGWRRTEWPRIKKKRAEKAAESSLSTNPATCSNR